MVRPKRIRRNMYDLKLPKKLSTLKVQNILKEHCVTINTIFVHKTKSREERSTFLHIAIERKNVELIDWLLDQDVDIDVKLPRKGPPINVAIKHEDFHTIRKLVSRGANLNHREPGSGNTPVGEAFKYYRIDIVNYLIENGADVDIPPCKGQFRNNEYSLLQIYVEKKADLKMTELILSKGVDVNYKSPDGLTPLICAISKGNLDVVKLLIEHGANIDCVYEKNDDILTILHAAINSKNFKVLEFFRDLDEPFTDVNIVSGRKRRSTLDFALDILWDRHKILNCLYVAGVDVNLEDCNGKLPIDKIQNTWDNNNHSLISHLVKLISADLPVCDRNRDGINSEFDYFAAECRQEVGKLKEMKINNVNNTTFYDVLHLSQYSLMNKVKNVQTDYNDENNKEILCKKFPLYGEMLVYKLAKAQRRLSRYVKAEEEVMKIFIRLGLPFDFCREMFQYLDAYDLKKIIGEKIMVNVQ